MSGVLPEPAGFPLGGADADGRLRWSRGDQALTEAVWTVLATNPGERLMRPGFGAGLSAFIHQPDTESTRRLVAAAAKEALERTEPRIVVQDVRVESPSPEGPEAGRLRLTLRWQRRGRPGETGGLSLALDLGQG
ncbi:GPW/gp25 family protein [Paracraurococcus ruber]|uniref:IraD/Gp25-like domain-containing protein n=1 Tax=Paracraurococcus ruber TaxID=77675 RepID=A0ABS1CSE4_9PROT|nr:GPW/gp25 family protein [Paracraurococcus ruber]MBK1657111.1 hypothetical protein [Paracraurococcus ruber]TDG33409.1 hypothetical protein E2C05_04075 [Paracraurococcus ruber]